MNENQHLKAEELAVCVEAINQGKFDSLPDSWRRHLETCDECAGEVLMVSEIEKELQQIHESPFDAPVKKAKVVKLKDWQKILITVSAAASLVYALVSLLNTDSQSEPTVAEQVDSIKQHSEIQVTTPIATSPKQNGHKETKHVLLAEFRPNEHLEKLFIANREAHRSSHSEILLPDTVYFSDQGSLKLNLSGRPSLNIEFFNNRDEIVQAIQVQSSSLPIPELSKGLYYYKIFNDDYDLLFIGKLIVN